MNPSSVRFRALNFAVANDQLRIQYSTTRTHQSHNQSLSSFKYYTVQVILETVRNPEPNKTMTLVDRWYSPVYENFGMLECVSCCTKQMAHGKSLALYYRSCVDGMLAIFRTATRSRMSRDTCIVEILVVSPAHPHTLRIPSTLRLTLIRHRHGRHQHDVDNGHNARTYNAQRTQTQPNRWQPPFGSNSIRHTTLRPNSVRSNDAHERKVVAFATERAALPIRV